MSLRRSARRASATASASPAISTSASAPAISRARTKCCAYYRTHEADFDVEGSACSPFAEARDEARRRLIESRTDALIREWVAALRRRVEVTLLPK